MISLTVPEHEALGQVVRAGADGAALRDVGLSVGLRLQIAGLVSITPGEPQQVVATAHGAAFHRRGAFA